MENRQTEISISIPRQSPLVEWSKEKTLRLISYMQTNPFLWNPSASESRRVKQKRKEELKLIAKTFNVCVLDITKKIQHLRTQYNREAAREARIKAEDPDDKYEYESNWYAFEYLHFLKGSQKPYKFIEFNTSNAELFQYNEDGQQNRMNESISSNNSIAKYETASITEPQTLNLEYRDEFTIFGEYVAHELRSLKGEKNRLMAKKRIQDALFEVKMDSIQEATPVHTPHAAIDHSQLHHNVSNCKFTPQTSTPINASQDTDAANHPEQQSNMSEIIINACHYPQFKVDVHTHKTSDETDKDKLYSSKLSAFSM